MLPFLLTAFGLGLAAIFTPCVFPMIPITVSFFLNQRGGILQAVVFSLGIVVLFCALGLGVTAAVGAVRSESIRCESLGQRIHHTGLRRVRTEPAWGLRNHAAVQHADQARLGLAPRRLPRNVADGPDVRADFVRLHRTVHGELAGGVGAIQGLAAGAGHGELREAAWRRRSSSWLRSRRILKSCPRAAAGWRA